MESTGLTYTVVTDSDGLDPIYLQNILDKNGWKFIEIDKLLERDDPYVDMIWVDADEVQREVWNIRCLFKNIFDSKKISITNKCKLYDNMVKNCPKIASKHLPATQYLNNFKYESGKVFIVRPCGRSFYSGIGIYIITNQQEYEKVNKIYNQHFIIKKNRRENVRDQYFNVIVSEYITNPLLIDGRKFHLRMYLMINIFPKYSHHLFEIGKIITSKKKYVLSTYDDKEIHDTHMMYNDKNLFFPKHLTDVDTDIIMKQMINITDAIASVFKKDANPYPESKTAYEIFGLDFMVDSTLNVYLIELNDRVGYAPAEGRRDTEYKNFNKKYFEWVYTYAILPIALNIADIS